MKERGRRMIAKMVDDDAAIEVWKLFMDGVDEGGK